MQIRVGPSIAVMMAGVLGHVRASRIEQMRSLVRPIAKQLNDILKVEKILKLEPEMLWRDDLCLQNGHFGENKL